MTKIKIIDDDAVVAMVVVGAISIAALFALPGTDAKEIVLMAVGGILALARGREKRKGGLPGEIS